MERRRIIEYDICDDLRDNVISPVVVRDTGFRPAAKENSWKGPSSDLHV